MRAHLGRAQDHTPVYGRCSDSPLRFPVVAAVVVVVVAAAALSSKIWKPPKTLLPTPAPAVAVAVGGGPAATDPKLSRLNEATAVNWTYNRYVILMIYNI